MFIFYRDYVYFNIRYIRISNKLVYCVIGHDFEILDWCFFHIYRIYIFFFNNYTDQGYNCQY